LIKTFGPHLADVRNAMEGLAARYEPIELNRIGFQLYEQFLPSGPYGREGKRGKTVLQIENILAALPYATEHDGNSPGPNALLHRRFPHIAKPLSFEQQLACKTNWAMAEHCQNVRRIKEAIAKMQATLKELESAMPNSPVLIAESREVPERRRYLMAESKSGHDRALDAAERGAVL
jgi:hypothetical protein